MGAKPISTGTASSLYPVIPSSWLSEAASSPACTSTLIEPRPKSVGLSFGGHLNAPGSPTPTQCNWFQSQQDPDLIVLKVVPPPVEVRLFSAPDVQVGRANSAQTQPGTGLATQPDEGLQHQVPQHAKIEERDQLISVDRKMSCRQGEEPWIVNRATESVWATKPSFKSAPLAEPGTNSSSI